MVIQPLFPRVFHRYSASNIQFLQGSDCNQGKAPCQDLQSKPEYTGTLLIPLIIIHQGMASLQRCQTTHQVRLQGPKLLLHLYYQDGGDILLG